MRRSLFGCVRRSFLEGVSISPGNHASSFSQILWGAFKQLLLYRVSVRVTRSLVKCSHKKGWKFMEKFCLIFHAYLYSELVAGKVLLCCQQYLELAGGLIAAEMRSLRFFTTAGGANNVGFNIRAHTCFDFMTSTALETLLKANKRQKYAGAFELRFKESSISVQSEEIVFQSVKWKQRECQHRFDGWKCWFNSSLLSSKSCRRAILFDV